MYAQKVEGDSWLGEKLDKGKIDKMNGTVPCCDGIGCVLMWRCKDQQLGQLYELMLAIQNKREDNGGEEI